MPPSTVYFTCFTSANVHTLTTEEHIQRFVNVWTSLSLHIYIYSLSLSLSLYIYIYIWYIHIYKYALLVQVDILTCWKRGHIQRSVNESDLYFSRSLSRSSLSLSLSQTLSLSLSQTLSVSLSLSLSLSLPPTFTDASKVMTFSEPSAEFLPSEWRLARST